MMCYHFESFTDFTVHHISRVTFFPLTLLQVFSSYSTVIRSSVTVAYTPPPTKSALRSFDFFHVRPDLVSQSPSTRPYGYTVLFCNRVSSRVYPLHFPLPWTRPSPLYLVCVRLQSPSRLRSLSFTTSTPCTFLPPDLTLVFSVLINTQSMWVFIFRKEEGVITSDSNDENNQQRTMTPTTDTFYRGRRCRCHDLLLFESRRCHDFSVVVTKLFSAEYKKV